MKLSEQELQDIKKLKQYLEEFSGLGFKSGGFTNIRAVRAFVMADSVLQDEPTPTERTQMTHTLLEVKYGNSICAPIVADYAASAMRLIPTLLGHIAALEAQERWIPCSERLPDNPQDDTERIFVLRKSSRRNKVSVEIMDTEYFLLIVNEWALDIPCPFIYWKPIGELPPLPATPTETVLGSGDARVDLGLKPNRMGEVLGSMPDITDEEIASV